MKYLLDTNICIYLIRQKPAAVLARVQARQADDLAVSTITVAELEYGIARSRYPDRNRVALLEFLVPLVILDFDRRAAARYGDIRASLASRGKPIRPLDLLLAAQARAHGLTLVTNNEREFRRVEGLAVENWAKTST